MFRTMPSLSGPGAPNGPDFWTFYAEHPGLISDDTIHPTGPGFAAYRQLWASYAIANVYGAGGDSSPAP